MGSDSAFKSSFHISIIGAGLVGLALSLSLHKAGYKVTVFENDEELKDVGAGIVLPPNSTRVLRSLGVLPAIQARSSASRYWVSHSYRARPSAQADGVADADPLAALALVPDMQERYNSPFLVIHRADLRKILYEAAVANQIDIRLGTKVDVKSTDFVNGRVCILKNGATSQRQWFSSDLVIAADGQASSAREFLADKPITPHWGGIIINRVLMTAEKMRSLGIQELISPPSVHIWQGPRTLATGYLLKDVFYLALTTNVSGQADMSAIKEELFRGPRPASKEELEKVYHDPWDPRIQTLIEHGHGFLKWMALDFHSDPECPKSWVRDDPSEKLALTLIGDSAHAIKPFLGSGAAMGFEDASLLSGLLSRCNSTAQVRKQLHIFESERRPRTQHVGRMTDKMGRTWMLPDGAAQASRDQAYHSEGGIGVTGRETAGFPNALQDPFFQPWLYGFDGAGEAERLWAKQKRESRI